MPRRTIKVCVRTRPTASFAQDEIAIEPSQSTITINKNGGREEVPVEGVPGDNLNSNYQFRFHHVLHNASQDTVYETLARDVVADAVDGINGTIMSYGQTGSGKTFTMMGDTANYQHRGVAPRSIAHVFQEVNLRVETAFSITCSYMEIYNEKVRCRRRRRSPLTPPSLPPSFRSSTSSPTWRPPSRAPTSPSPRRRAGEACSCAASPRWPSRPSRKP